MAILMPSERRLELRCNDAIISDDGVYRYLLTRWWGDLLTQPEAARILPIAMLNPSKADAKLDDPTVRKCIGFASRLGYSGIGIVNKYAFRATDPSELEHAADPVGEDNDFWIQTLFGMTDVGGDVLVAWGQPGPKAISPARVARIVELAQKFSKRLVALKVNEVGARAGHPSHPLMLSYGCTLRPWSSPNAVERR